MIYGFALVGVFVTIGALWLLILDLLDLFKKWRRDDCKIKFLCKHDFNYICTFNGRMYIKCKKCKKRIDFKFDIDSFKSL